MYDTLEIEVTHKLNKYIEQRYVLHITIEDQSIVFFNLTTKPRHFSHRVDKFLIDWYKINNFDLSDNIRYHLCYKITKHPFNKITDFSKILNQ